MLRGSADHTASRFVAFGRARGLPNKRRTVPSWGFAPLVAERKAARSTIQNVIGYMPEVLGHGLVVYIAGVSDERSDGECAANGGHGPTTSSTCVAPHDIFQLILAKETVRTVRAWFLALKLSSTRDRGPAATANGMYREVLIAAKVFVAGIVVPGYTP